MFTLNNNEVLFDNKVIFELSFAKDLITGKIINTFEGINSQEFYEFYKNNLKDKSREFIVSSGEFSGVEEDFLESLTFHFYESIYIEQEDKFINSYRYVYKEVEVITDTALSDIIEKLDL